MEFTEFIRDPNPPKMNSYYQLFLDLGSKVEQKKIVYLDTKYWVTLMKACVKDSKNKKDYYLLELIMDLSSKDICIFPISEDVFIEVLRQTDPATLDVTIELIDRLSKGVSLVNFESRVRLEFLDFLYKSQGIQGIPLSSLVWTKLALNLGELFPVTNDPLLRGVDDLYLAELWGMELRGVLSLIGDKGVAKLSERQPSWSGKVNDEVSSRVQEFKSFKQIFMNELAGVVDVYKDSLSEVIAYLYEKESGLKLSSKDLVQNNTALKMYNLVCNLFKNNKAGSSFPTFEIMAGCFSSVRRNYGQRFRDNDMHDFRHAAAALPYCDVFLTEKMLANLVSQKITSYDKKYDCKVIWQVGDANDVLSSFLKSNIANIHP